MIDKKTGNIVVEYNGYTGIAFGHSSYIVRDSKGNEIFHTGFTTNEIRTEEEALEYLKETLVMLDHLRRPQSEEDTPVMCDYIKGVEDAWHVARQLTSPDTGGLYENDKALAFGYRSSDKILRTLSGQEALQKFRTWQNYKNDIHIGDEVFFVTEAQRTVKCVLTCIEGDRYGYVDEDGHCGAFQGRCFEKTGKTHPGIIHVINELAGRL